MKIPLMCRLGLHRWRSLGYQTLVLFNPKKRSQRRIVGRCEDRECVRCYKLAERFSFRSRTAERDWAKAKKVV